MKGYVEHDSRRCTLGAHTNRGAVAAMCPVYLELRRQRLKLRMRADRYLDKYGDTADGRIGAMLIKWGDQA